MHTELLLNTINGLMSSIQIFNKILDNINIVLTTIIGIAFASQLMYTLFFFVPSQKFKKADKFNKFAVLIPARNESKVIADTIECIKKMNYPKDRYDIYVIADNCTDDTAEIARNSGAIVLEHNDDNPKHKKVSYALEYFFDIMLKENKDYDAYIRFDADNLVHPDYIARMNDALCEGAEFARGYNNSKNLTENVVSGVSGLWYIRDCRFASQGRSFLRTAQMVPGSGMMIKASIIKEQGGWTALGISEDSEITMNLLFKKHKAVYVSDAILYDDQPTTLNDCLKRNIRIGHGIHKLFYTHGIKAFFFAFTHMHWGPRWFWSIIDMFLTLFFVPIAVLCCTWLPLYYGYSLIYNACIGNWALFNTILSGIGIALVCAFIIPFILQAVLVYFLDKKKINKPFKKLLPAILLFPMFMIIYALGIFLGALSKPKWSPIKRSSSVNLNDFEKSITPQDQTPMPDEQEVIEILNDANEDNTKKDNDTIA